MSDENFEFSIDRIRSQFSRADLIESLKRYSQIHGDPRFGMRNYDSWNQRLASSDTIQRYFGTWGKALQAAGMRTVRGHRIDPKAMVEAFKACWRQHKSVPSVRQLENFLGKGNYPFRCKSYLNLWGGLGELAALVVEFERDDLAESQLYKRQKPKAVLERSIPLRLRLTVLQRDGYWCVKCGANPNGKSTRLEVDHIIPVSRGGKSDLNNLQTLCFACNQGKKNRDD